MPLSLIFTTLNKRIIRTYSTELQYSIAASQQFQLFISCSRILFLQLILTYLHYLQNICLCLFLKGAFAPVKLTIKISFNKYNYYFYVEVDLLLTQGIPVKCLGWHCKLTGFAGFTMLILFIPLRAKQVGR